MEALVQHVVLVSQVSGVAQISQVLVSCVTAWPLLNVDTRSRPAARMLGASPALMYLSSLLRYVLLVIIHSY